MSSVTLRDYQERDAERIRQSYRSGKKAPLYVAPCGSGKTVLFSYIAENAVKRGTEILALCHRKELLDQISNAFTTAGLPHGMIHPEHQHHRGYQAYVASVFSLARHLDLCNPGLIVVDEAHHTAATTTWGRILEAYPKARRLGVTATPTRMSGEGLRDFYDDLILGPTYDELTAAGYLTPIRAFAPPSINTSGLHTRGGDFIPSEVIERATKPSVTGDCIEHYRQHASGKRCVVFDVSVDSARSRADAFRSAGFSAHCIDGEMAGDIRRQIISAFRCGSIQVITSCDLISEGFDLPAIEVGICLRPTRSLALWMQQAGRILRPSPGKTEAILLDHARNIELHGLPNEQREWSLESGVQKSTGGSKSVRLCLHCFAVNRPGARVCAQCGEHFPREPRQVSQKKGKLKELTPEDLREMQARRTRSFQQWQAKDLPSLIALAKKRGMSNPEGWARHILKARAARVRE